MNSPLSRGDIVVAVPPFVLACGCGRYSHAIVVSESPFVLVSEGGDMLWSATVTPEDVRYFGRDQSRTPMAFRRWENELRPLARRTGMGCEMKRRLKNAWHNIVIYPIAGMCWLFGMQRLGDWVRDSRRLHAEKPK